MIKINAFVIMGCLFFINGFSQNKFFEKILKEIEQNNTELKGYKSLIESRQLENKSENNLPDPELSAYYLPFGNATSETYLEYQISQSFEFPSVYKSRSMWNDTKTQQLQTSYAKKRQELLLKAKTLVIEITFLHQHLQIEQERRAQSKLVFDQIQELFKKDQVGILDFNKAKVAWLQEQFDVEQLQMNIQILMSNLKTLNGGKIVNEWVSDLILPMDIGSIEDLWQEKLVKDPYLQELKANEAASLQKIKLEKNMILPNVALGYNYQGISGSKNSGFYGGLSIPLWNSRYKVKAAKADYEYQQSNTEGITSSLFAQFQENYLQYELMLEKYNEYQTTLGNLNSEKLLLKAFMLGEYSFLDYYVELQFYRIAKDKILQMEKELQLLQAQLLKYQL